MAIPWLLLGPSLPRYLANTLIVLMRGDGRPAMSFLRGQGHLRFAKGTLKSIDNY